jgi:hypothetical protein
MAVLAFLRRLVVVRRCREDRTHARARRNFFGFGYGVVCGIRRRTRHDGDASGGDFDGDVNHAQPLVVSERGSFASSAAGNQEVDARFDLPGDQITKRSFIDSAVGGERRDQSCTTASELHGARITPKCAVVHLASVIRGARAGKRLQLTPDIAEFEEAGLAL